LTAISLQADQGHWEEALSAAKTAVDAAEAAGPFAVRRYRITELSLLSFSSSHPDFLRSLRQFLDAEIDVLKRKDDVDHPAALFHVLFGAYLAARSGDADLANVAIATVRDEVRDSGYPNLVNLLAIAEAERARATGHVQDAVELLKAQLRGAELYLTHIALRDAYVSAGQDADSLKESSWLAGHRGLAYEELNDDQALQPFNVVASDLALLSQAEILAKLGRQEESSNTLGNFLAAWPDAKRVQFVARRLDSFAH